VPIPDRGSSSVWRRRVPIPLPKKPAFVRKRRRRVPIPATREPLPKERRVEGSPRDLLSSNFVNIYTTEKKYEVVVIDPPVRFRSHNKDGTINAKYQGQADKHYKTMTVAELCKLPVARILAENAAVLIFVPPTHIFDYAPVYRAWGLKYINFFMVWQKTNKYDTWQRSRRGMGSYTRGVMEWGPIFQKGSLAKFTDAGLAGVPLTYVPGSYVFGNHLVLSDYQVVQFARKNKVKECLVNRDRKQAPLNVQATESFRTPEIDEETAGRVVDTLLEGRADAHELKVFPSVVLGPRTDHSTKPQEVFDYVKQLFCRATSFLELFARKKRSGWDVWGDDPNIVPID